jgi:hypothetical protein
MPRAASGNGIHDPVQIRALRLITPTQFGILVSHGTSTVEKWIRKGWVRTFTALDTVNVLIRIEEVDRFLKEREEAEATKRAGIARARRSGPRTTA